ncbi:SIMPL domain-containing protein [Gilvimarinus sp. SDUM040013]|uniref:SIMPL domain-containing protein n=1 Tax=Gilvimarinus gilvus TaxID=3058038 RepID=A0ABU4RZA8_9GAMM|nr:SIMPL domain-containing protein [Gilvimarinus sp. SDUM040013]MDO3388662.1 SIMPL domain-containing protein [Gilvimarinus sp. SDUM040013]MDX6849557.1 SIMPL domain-containing protein [Gilvimarinus sp. SDUM040013]
MQSSRPALIFGAFLLVAFGILGYFGKSAAIAVKEYERTVTAKGLAEREMFANIVIWPISFTLASNQLSELYTNLDQSSTHIRDFLAEHGIASRDITTNAPVITDKSAQSYGADSAPFRYVATAVVTVYSEDLQTVRKAMANTSNLGKNGIVLTAGNYDARTEYLFTGLNDIKPAMIEEATVKAREVANKFAIDSGSRLGKIKRASQGQFSISARDANNPHIKKVRVVSTVEYYLTD